MPPTTPPLDFNHQKGVEIPTKHKEAIRQLYGFAKVPVQRLMTRYKLGRIIIERVLQYDAPERSRITRTGAPLRLTDKQVNEIIKYASESWDHRVLDYSKLYDELGLECSVKTLERRLK